MKSKKRERMFRGIISLLILQLLWKSPKYGYSLEKEIAQEIGEKLSDGEIYSILRNLEIKKLLISYTKPEGGRVRKYYEINEGGKQFLIDHKHSLNVAAAIIDEMRSFIESNDHMTDDEHDPLTVA